VSALDPTSHTLPASAELPWVQAKYVRLGSHQASQDLREFHVLRV
jgi:hypothetical protein